MNASKQIMKSCLADALPSSLRDLYGDRTFRPIVWRDQSDHAYINIVLLERSISLLARHLAGDLLDVGCGQQPYAKYFSQVRTKKACDIDAKRGQVDFVCPAHCIPLPDESLDSILCTEVLEHVPEPKAVWMEFNRLLRPGGKVLLATPMYWPGHEQPYDFYRYTEFGLRYLAKSAGFEVNSILPRGGIWAFFGQAVLHCLPQYFRFRWQRNASNYIFLKLDSWRCNPRITIGWTILATKPAGDA
jgi:SAM-dependent methyltransferase